MSPFIEIAFVLLQVCRGPREMPTDTGADLLVEEAGQEWGSAAGVPIVYQLISVSWEDFAFSPAARQLHSGPSNLVTFKGIAGQRGA